MEKKTITSRSQKLVVKSIFLCGILTHLLCVCLDLKNDPPDGIRALPLDNHWCHWQATILGPSGSPFEGGKFFLYIQIPYGYAKLILVNILNAILIII